MLVRQLGRPTNTKYLRHLLLRVRRNIQKNFLVRLIHKIIYHLTKLPQIGAGERLPYIKAQARKAMGKITSMSNPNSNNRDIETFLRYAGTSILRYRPQTYPSRLVLLVDEQAYHHNPTRGWADLAAGGLEIHVVPGTSHKTLYTENLQVTTERLRACLDAAQAPLEQPVGKVNQTPEMA